jgi:gamma-glutamyl:cysteine ligase YbdK (ATP-grasp superfamily)
LNLPFGDDEEFGRLHAAIRLVLPLLPALAASSPVVGGVPADNLDARMAFYRNNARRIPEVAGRIVPEPVFSPADYHEKLLQPLYRAIAPHDPQGILQHEWLNARGTIARFDRGAFEIRVLDIQECPAADLAVAALVVAALQGLVDQRWCSYAEQQRWEVDPLADLLEATIRDGEEAEITSGDYLAAFGCPLPVPCRAGDLWRHLYNAALPAAGQEIFGGPLRTIVREGTLSRRMLRALGPAPDRSRIAAVYRTLCGCLAAGRMFDAAAARADDRVQERRA